MTQRDGERDRERASVTVISPYIVNVNHVFSIMPLSVTEAKNQQQHNIHKLNEL